MKYCSREGVENGHSNEKIAEKTFLFLYSLAKSALNGWLVAVFLSLVLGSFVRKLQEDFPETAWKNTEVLCDQLTFSIIKQVRGRLKS